MFPFAQIIFRDYPVLQKEVSEEGLRKTDTCRSSQSIYTIVSFLIIFKSVTSFCFNIYYDYCTIWNRINKCIKCTNTKQILSWPSVFQNRDRKCHAVQRTTKIIGQSISQAVPHNTHSTHRRSLLHALRK